MSRTYRKHTREPRRPPPPLTRKWKLSQRSQQELQLPSQMLFEVDLQKELNLQHSLDLLM